MRLICPNCDAQYEVDDSVIPDSGRDVQCSACGHTWFQQAARALADAQEAAAEPEPFPDHEDWEVAATAPDEDEASWAREDAALAAAVAAATEPEPAPEPAPAPEPPEVAAARTEHAEAEDTGPAPANAAAAETARRTMDESLLAILREEAQHEARARKAEGSSLETQPDLGLTEIPAAVVDHAAAVAPPPATERGAQIRPDPLDTVTAEGPRRDRLPDIEVINSSLRAATERGAASAELEAPEQLSRRRSGFRAGFLLVVALAAAATAVYAYATRIGTAAPALQPVLGRYVAGVNEGRVWLDANLRSVIEALQPQD